MIDPTANTLAHKLMTKIPDSRLGLSILHRFISAAKFAPAPKGVTVKKLRIKRYGNQGEIGLVIVSPVEMAENMPLILHIHGGGYVIGTPEQDIGLAKNYIDKVPSIFVMPDYRLVTEAPFPAAMHDCYDTLLWMKENASELGGNKNQIFVMGESAGGGLTASLCQYAHAQKEVNIACQFPIYGMIDDREENWTDIDPKLLTWSKAKNKIGWDLHLGDNRNDPPKFAAPARTENLEGLPPAINFIGDQDIFLEENIEYFKRLNDAGVEAKIKVFKGAYHGVELMAGNSNVAKEVWTYALDEFERATKNYTAAN